MKKKYAILSLVIVFTIALFIFPKGALATGILEGARNSIAEFFWNITYVLLNVFLYILQFVGSLFEAVAGVQNFFSDGVNAAWEATRDFANLFFALMLLFIAIATVLGMNQYSAKNMLPKFFIAALFINFSKALVGVLIDISQIIMFEFYNALGENITNNAVNFSQITYFHNGVPEPNGNQFELFMNGVILNLIMILLIVILIAAFIWGTLTLAIRLVTLWVLISLSPVAFVSMIVPPLSGAFNEWKNSLSEQLVKGPAFMFFVWLAFIVLNATTDTLYTPTNELSGNGLDSSFTTFFTDGGPFIGFTLTAIFLFMANNIAEKAATAAPGVGAKLAGSVGKYINVATLGAANQMGLAKGSQGFLKDVKGVAKETAMVGNAATLGTAGIGYSVLKNSPVGYKARRTVDNFREDTKKGKTWASHFSKEAKEYKYNEWKKERDKFVNERELVSGNSAVDKKTLDNFRKAERDAQSEIKDLDSPVDLITKMGKSKDLATRRQILRKLASEKDGLSESNLDDIGKELGLEFKEGSSREEKLQQTIEKLNFGNKNYQEYQEDRGKDLSTDIAKALAKNGDYTYRPKKLAQGAKAGDPVVSNLKSSTGEKQFSSMNETNFTQRDAQGNTVLNIERFESFLKDALAESDLKNEKLYSKLPKKEWQKWIEQAYPDLTQAPPNVQIFHNQVVHGSAGGSKGGGSKPQTPQILGPDGNPYQKGGGSKPQTPQILGSNGNPYTAGVNADDMDDN